MPTSSSLEAYQRILPYIRDKHQQILRWMMRNTTTPPHWRAPWTHNEIAQLIHSQHVPLEEVWKRLRELARLGVIRCLPKAPCRAANGNALRWELLRRPPTIAELRNAHATAQAARRRLQSMLEHAHSDVAVLREQLKQERVSGAALAKASELLQTLRDAVSLCRNSGALVVPKTKKEHVI